MQQPVRRKLPPQYFHLVFSALMAALMAFFMTGVVTYVNVGLTEDFTTQWRHAFAVAYCIAAPMIFVLVPRVRRFVSRWVEMP
ncbi:DUF2798 domain-containing protein [Sinimarinibacterium sp. CAU 1509]|uniref:DUF2798 domain-containing protein n=1 Tax=Sinimarinibacterium sp. CAU 1509 TaxID=2562283 RepID=UPI0010AD3780|nr:DUF2798 domain-containing protein [Sinimarinibacterium sp. CAU 1509]TJY59851.1 DUF2798 domain-containing protein [Sinimarinibacterium sp. CAU 1509]